MELWRISNYPDLSGAGGLHAGGRWHSKGRRIVYLADHPSSALLETLVHLELNMIPATYQLLRVRSEKTIEVEKVEVVDLPADWLRRIDVTRQIGDQWLDRSSSSMLQVPSAISVCATNVLLNPDHRDAVLLSVVEAIIAPFDPRLRKVP